MSGLENTTTILDILPQSQILNVACGIPEMAKRNTPRKLGPEWPSPGPKWPTLLQSQGIAEGRRSVGSSAASGGNSSVSRPNVSSALRCEACSVRLPLKSSHTTSPAATRLCVHVWVRANACSCMHYVCMHVRTGCGCDGAVPTNGQDVSCEWLMCWLWYARCLRQQTSC